MVIFNGQADVERGSSQNAAMMVTNLSDTSKLSKRIVKDHMHSYSIIIMIIPADVIVNSQIIASVNSSSSPYIMYLPWILTWRKQTKRLNSYAPEWKH